AGWMIERYVKKSFRNANAENILYLFDHPLVQSDLVGFCKKLVWCYSIGKNIARQFHRFKTPTGYFLHFVFYGSHKIKLLNRISESMKKAVLVVCNTRRYQSLLEAWYHHLHGNIITAAV